MKELLPATAAILFGGGAVILVLWAIIAFFVAFTNAQNQMNWCQYKNGDWINSREETGRRWSPNPLTLGFTGECINPGDEGL